MITTAFLPVMLLRIQGRRIDVLDGVFTSPHTFFDSCTTGHLRASEKQEFVMGGFLWRGAQDTMLAVSRATSHYLDNFSRLS